METKLINIIGAAALVSLFIAPAAKAQIAPENLAAVKKRVETIRAFAQRLPENHRKALSTGAQNRIHLAERWEKIEALLRTGAAGFPGLRKGQRPRGGGEDSGPGKILAPKKVSDPDLDAAIPSFAVAGLTQSETSTAWCGNNVVVGFNDSGSFLETFLGAFGFIPSVSPSNSFSFNGFARSSNKGSTFTDMGFLNSDPVPAGSTFYDLFGDPVIQCTDQNTFYYASLASNTSMTFTSDISVSKSTNGGVSFGGPVPAASKDGLTHFLDKEWMAVDPTNANNVFVTYTDFDFSESSAACGSDFRTAIEFVGSTDGGVSWSSPVVIDEACDEAFVQGSQVVVGPNGEVYVAYQKFGADFVTREIDIVRSDDGGATFGTPVKVTDVVCVGDCFFLKGFFRAGFEFPSMAVDRSGKSTDGNVYIAWHDGNKLSVPDLGTFFTTGLGSYNFADVFVTRSDDMGATWSSPVKVNKNPEPLASGLGSDQYQPGIGVDHKTGKVGVCFYDRSKDKNNFFIDRTCAGSTNAGASWSEKKLTKKPFPPVPGQDAFTNPVYMGDYDTLASDSTKANSGFVGAWGDNTLGTPDVMAEVIK